MDVTNQVAALNLVITIVLDYILSNQDLFLSLTDRAHQSNKPSEWNDLDFAASRHHLVQGGVTVALTLDTPLGRPALYR